MNQNDNFADMFASEETQIDKGDAPPWKILLVDDEPDIHAVFQLALQNFEIFGRPLQFLLSNSAEHAKELLNQHDDIALVLLDVVMETERAGLDLVRYIRNDINNYRIHIFLITGQPGYAPQHEVISDYEINGYNLKTELSTEKIFALVHTALRSYQASLILQQEQSKLRESESRYIDLYENSPDMYVSVEADTAIVRDCNQTLCDKLGYSKAQIIGHPVFNLYHPDNLPAAQNAFKSFKETGVVTDVELQLKRQDGGSIDVTLNATSLRDENGRVCYSRSCLVDITERKKMEKELELAAKVFIHANEGITITDASGTIVNVNGAFSRITGYSREEALGKNPRILKSGYHDSAFYESMYKDLHTKGYWAGEIWNRRKNGEVYAEILNISAVRNTEGENQFYVALFSDITSQKEHQKQLEHVAHYDALTNLPNRVLLADRLAQSMVQDKRGNRNKIAIVYLDLDKFKEINDLYGHDTGDQLLIAISQRLQEVLREGDTIARIGGDEFIIIMNNLSHVSDYVPLLERLVHAAAMPVFVNNHVLNVSASLGVTFYPQKEPIDADQLFRQADQAMYKAKLGGKNQYHFFDIEQDQSIRGHHESLQRIKRALSDDEFILFYQPKINMRTGEIVGVEALIRWQHPDKGILPPMEFLSQIEGNPLSKTLDKWVINSALSQQNHWLNSGLNIPVSINIGPIFLEQNDFIECIADVLEAYPAVIGKNIQIEILESSALNDISQVSRVIEECNKLQLSFALDDFGTGYSSLNYLKKLPASTLKIDQSFVRDMLEDHDDLSIVEGIIGLAKAFKRDIVAEGVETHKHAEKLIALGCEIGQGYAYAKPMPPDSLLEWINARETR